MHFNFILRELQSKIRYKIIIPFLALTFLVALAGSTVALGLAAGSQQERFNNLVAEVTRSTNDSLERQEIAYLEYLQQIIFAPANPQTGAPAPVEALQNNNRQQILTAVTPYFLTGMRDSSLLFDRLVVFNTTGQALVDIGRYPLDATNTFTSFAQLDYSSSPYVARVLAGDRVGGGDKYAGVMQISTELANEEPSAGDPPTAFYFVTVTPVYRNNDADSNIVGGIILAQRLDRTVELLADRSRAAVVTIYGDQGQALVSSALEIGESEQENGVSISAIDIRQSTLEQLRAGQAPEEQSVFDVQEINQREYQMAFTPLLIRQIPVGYIAAGLTRDYVFSTVNDIQTPIWILTVIFMFAIFAVGAYVARQITRPLEELVFTARSVTSGDLRRRSQVKTKDEIGDLSNSFNTMTEYLLHLYNRVLAESGQLKAIVESITDGIIVCNRAGEIQMTNPAVARLLDLRDGDALPARFGDMPLELLPDGAAGFGPSHGANLYALGERIVRVADAPIMAKGKYLGDVYVLQDMTEEVNIAKAKTNFINTISHELQTPVTTLQSTTDILVYGRSHGKLNEGQLSEVKIMQQKLMGMTKLIKNVLAIANIDSGSTAFEPEVLDVRETIEDMIWNMQRMIKEKGLYLDMDIPEDLPPVLADYELLEMIVKQLIDNAYRYTEKGGITITAVPIDGFVQINVTDTGPGIRPENYERIFERFVRGTEPGQGVDSQERGIGLGLSIVKHLVEHHEGHVWVTSEPGHGSTLSFTLRQADVVGTPEEQGRAFGTAA